MKRWVPCLGASAALIVTDQILKQWVSSNARTLLLDAPRLPGFAGLTYAENRGAAFGILPNARWLFVALALLVSAVIVWALVRGYFASQGMSLSLLADVSMAVVMAGALGNAIDRALTGFVVDYIELLFMDFAIFNFADICVVGGGCAFILYALLSRPRTEETPDAVDAERSA